MCSPKSPLLSGRSGGSSSQQTMVTVAARAKAVQEAEHAPETDTHGEGGELLRADDSRGAVAPGRRCAAGGRPGGEFVVRGWEGRF